MGTKICTKCGKEKTFSEYSKHRECKNGLNSRCKVCKNKTYKNWYRKQTPLERQLRILANGILKRTSSEEGYYHNKGIENRLGENRAEVMDFLRDNFSADIQSLLDRGERVSVDRIDSAGHYSADNVRIMSLHDNALMGSMAAKKLNSHAVLIEDTTTGNITKATSIHDASRVIGCNYAAVHKHINRNNPSPIFGRYTVKREEEELS